MQIRLQIQGPEKSETLDFSIRPGQVFSVGRKGCNLTLEDSKVSRRHLSLTEQNGSVFLEDLGSHNGTFFEEKRVTSREVSEGEQYRIGSHYLQFLSVQADSTTVKQEKKTSPGLLSLEHELPPNPIPDPVPTRDDLPVSASEPGGEDEPQIPKGGASANEEFRFYRHRKLNFEDIKETYLYAGKNLQTFWQSTSYDIPFERSLPVLCVLSLISGFVSALANRNSLGIFSAASVATAKIAFVVILAAVLSQLRFWLKSTAQFHQVVAFSVYWLFLQLPVALLATGFFPLGGLLGFAFLVWGVWGFWKTFNPSFARLFAILAAVVIALLGIGGAVAFLAYTLFKVGAGNVSV